MTPPERGGGRPSVIWKFPIEIADEQDVAFPDGARLLHAGLDPSGAPCIWALVDPSARSVDRVIVMLGTGNPIPEGGSLIHLSSFVYGPFVWHVFLEGP